MKVFSFGFKTKNFVNILKARPAEPIAETEAENEDFGLCDECGEFSAELILLEGKWMCRECSGMY